MNIQDHWPEIKKIFERTGKKSGYYSFASVDKKGNPHVTPIGSLIFRDQCRGFFFDRFPQKMKTNFDVCPRVAVMTVNTGFFYWFTSLQRGKFKTPPGIRLYGEVSPLRDATEEETTIWQKRVRRAKGTKGYDILWKDMAGVRDIRFDQVRLVTAGAMTKEFVG